MSQIQTFAPSSAPRPASILIAEDSPTQAAQIAQFLEDLGFTVCSARSGNEAYSLALDVRPDILISDIIMPGLDGYQLCRRLKSTPGFEHLPVILVTSLSQPQDVLEGLDAGADNFIIKPYDENVLHARINYLLNNKHLRNVEKASGDLEIELSGERRRITAHKQQILDLLISTYAQAVHLFGALDQGRQELSQSYDVLYALYDITDGLNRCRTPAEVAAAAVARSLGMPGIRHAWIYLRHDAGPALAAERHLGRADTADPFPPPGADPLGEEADAPVIHRIAAMPPGAPALFQGLHHASLRLRIGARTVGYLHLAGTEPPFTGDVAARTLATIAGQTAVALERAMLHTNLEQEVRKRTVRLTREVEERRQAEINARRAEEQLHQAQKMEAVGNLTGGIAHDFNNLLTSIIGNLDLALLKPVAPEIRPLLDIALRASLRGAELTRKLLAFARKQPLEPRVLDINAMVDDLRILLDRTLGPHIDVVLEVQCGLPHVFADPTQLESALMNLAINARDAMPDGGTLRFGVARQAGADMAGTRAAGEGAGHAAYVVFSVSDTGTGIAPEHLERIFEPFFTTKDPGKGTGLGLAMVYGFAHQSGGAVWVASDAGRGTTFRLAMPALPEGSKPPEPQPHPPPLEEHALKFVLLVESNPEVRRTIKESLAQFGHRVQDVATVDEARAAMQAADPFDLLVADTDLPGRIGGTELARQFAARFPAAGVLLVSGSSEPPVSRPDLRVLSLPFRVTDLQRAIATLF